MVVLDLPGIIYRIGTSSAGGCDCLCLGTFWPVSVTLLSLQMQAGPHAPAWHIVDVIGSVIPGLVLILPAAGIALIGLLPAITRLSGSPYRVLLWEWVASLLPFVIWCGLMLSPLSRSRKTLANVADLYILGGVMAAVGVVVRWGGARGVSPRLLRVGFAVLNCGAAVLAFFLIPGLPES